MKERMLMEKDTSNGTDSKLQVGNLVRVDADRLPKILQLYEENWYGFLSKVPRLR